MMKKSDSSDKFGLSLMRVSASVTGATTAAGMLELIMLHMPRQVSEEWSFLVDTIIVILAILLSTIGFYISMTSLFLDKNAHLIYNDGKKRIQLVIMEFFLPWIAPIIALIVLLLFPYFKTLVTQVLKEQGKAVTRRITTFDRFWAFSIYAIVHSLSAGKTQEQ